MLMLMRNRMMRELLLVRMILACALVPDVVSLGTIEEHTHGIQPGEHEGE